MKVIALWMLLMASLVLATDLDETVETETPSELTATTPKEESPEPKGLIQWGVRMDSLYSGGGPIQQGFSLPSVRLTAFGDVTSHLAYRVSLGQTREFSSALLPQITPVEAYVDLSSFKRETEKNLAIRVGLFSPRMNPWWSPDLSDLDIPDYLHIHRSLLVGRDMGVELNYRNGALELALGMCNGSGIQSLNTNNTKAFTYFLKTEIQLAHVNIALGSGGMYLVQSTEGNINYKANWSNDVFLELTPGMFGLVLRLDVIAAEFRDSIGNLHPFGGAGSLAFNINSWLGVFSRMETISENPQGPGLLRNFQVGPKFDLGANLKAWAYYEKLEENNAQESTIQMRLRVVL